MDFAGELLAAVEARFALEQAGHFGYTAAASLVSLRLVSVQEATSLFVEYYPSLDSAPLQLQAQVYYLLRIGV